MNKDHLSKTQAPPIDTATYNVMLESAELCGDPQISFAFTLSPSTKKSVSVTSVCNATKDKPISSYPTTEAIWNNDNKRYYTPNTSIDSSQIDDNDLVKIKVTVDNKKTTSYSNTQSAEPTGECGDVVIND